MKLHAKQGGMTLVELMLVLAVGGVILVGAVVAGSLALNDSKVTNEASRLKLLSQRIEGAFSARTKNYSLVTNAFVIANISLAGTFDVSGTTITGGFGSVTITSGSDGPTAAANSSYQVAYAAGALSKSACVSLVAAAAPSFKVIKVGSTIVKAATASAADPVTAGNACTVGGVTTFIGYIS